MRRINWKVSKNLRTKISGVSVKYSRSEPEGLVLYSDRAPQPFQAGCQFSEAADTPASRRAASPKGTGGELNQANISIVSGHLSDVSFLSLLVK
jgi:hypothetical protein